MKNIDKKIVITSDPPWPPIVVHLSAASLRCVLLRYHVLKKLNNTTT